MGPPTWTNASTRENQNMDGFRKWGNYGKLWENMGKYELEKTTKGESGAKFDENLTIPLRGSECWGTPCRRGSSMRIPNCCHDK